jgi:HK97 family phage major capsid protein
MPPIEDLMTQINGRLDAIGEQVSESRLKQIVTDHLSGLDDNDPVVRKMRHGASADPELIGSKFSRWGYTSADVEWLYDFQQSLRGKPKTDGGQFTGPSPELEKAFKAVSSAYYLTEDEAKSIDRRAIDEIYPRIPNQATVARFGSAHSYRKWADPARAAAMAALDGPSGGQRASSMDSGTSGYGSQLIGAQYVGDLWDAAFQDGRIAPLIPTFEMTAPTAYLPVAVDMPEMSFVSESTSDVLATAQYGSIRTGSQRVTVTAKKFVVHQVWSLEMEEDSIVPYVPFLRQQAARGVSFWTDYVVLNGDTVTAGTGNINSDDAAPGATKAYLAFDGIRKAAIVDNTANIKNLAGAAITLNTLRDLKGLMRDDTRKVDFGHPNDPNDLIFVGDLETADRVALLDEIVAAKIERGAGAELLNGQVSSFLGHPVIGTMAADKTDTDYKYTTTSASTADVYGQLTAFNRNAFVLGWRRRVKMFTEVIPASDQMRIVYSLRLGFGRFTPTGAASGIEGAALAGFIGL